jgi:very-short-patch-repair endonuclease
VQAGVGDFCTSTYEVAGERLRRPVDGGARTCPIWDRLAAVPLSLEQLLHRLGGVSTRAALIELTSRAAVDRALREGRLVRVAHGRYALPTVDAARRAAAVLHGVVSHRSAAAYWGWGMKLMPDHPCITVGRNRKLPPHRRDGVELHWGSPSAADVVDGWVTSPARTFVDCCRDLPFDQVLAIADSALRSRSFTSPGLLEIARSMRGPGRATCLRVAHEATGDAANPFESVLRAIALGVPGLGVRPQVLVLDEPFSVRPDLSDERLRIALEADSFEWHGNRDALKRDCRRYNLLVAHGWRVLRFTWEDVMLEPEHVRRTLLAVVGLAERRAEVHRGELGPA